MAAEEPAATETPAPGKKKPRWLIPVAVVALLLIGIGGFLMLRHSSGPARPDLSKAAEYYELDPSIVVNFTDDRAIRFLQVGVSLMSHDPQAIEAAKAADPRIRNALLLLFSSQTFESLSSAKGKLQLQKEALQKVRDIVPAPSGSPGIEALYFTSFVMQ